jgi:DNA-binding transcriptional regulator YiaG
MNEHTTQNVSADKPYPRRCSECGKVAVRSVKIPYDAKIKHDGKLHEFHIAELPVDRCDECKEEFFTNVTSDAKSDALRGHLGLLQPAQIRELLAKHNLTQRKFATHLRVAEESVSRWLNGLSIQSRALDTFMRVYFARPEVREMLASEGSLSLDIDKPASSPVVAVAWTYQYESTTIHPAFGRRFAAAAITRSRRFQLVPLRN